MERTGFADGLAGGGSYLGTEVPSTELGKAGKEQVLWWAVLRSHWL